MKTPEEILSEMAKAVDYNAKVPNEAIKVLQIIKNAQDEAYNQALDDVTMLPETYINSACYIRMNDVEKLKK